MTRIQPKSAVSMHCWRGIAIISLLVGAMLFRVWQKVEVAHLDRQYDQAQHQLVALNEERTRLMAGIAFRKKLELIEHVAVGQMGMVYSVEREAVANNWSAKDLD
ncbi:MAG: hypothetical protein VXY00_00395 [Candidatus Latescibacterota bacterium]|nr:hypothetical protein [Candidatus Latescibacterota bacterium]MEE2727458.1 hypothetical protein [Candidatus Latescibacterota bacterium]